jgi:hypothetical protein
LETTIERSALKKRTDGVEELATEIEKMAGEIANKFSLDTFDMTMSDLESCVEATISRFQLTSEKAAMAKHLALGLILNEVKRQLRERE